MSFSALGIGGTASADGTVTVKAQILDDATGKALEIVTVTGRSLEDCRAQLQAELDAREDGAADLTIAAAVNGQVLATSRSASARQEVAAAAAAAVERKMP